MIKATDEKLVYKQNETNFWTFHGIFSTHVANMGWTGTPELMDNPKSFAKHRRGSLNQKVKEQRYVYLVVEFDRQGFQKIFDTKRGKTRETRTTSMENDHGTLSEE